LPIKIKNNGGFMITMEREDIKKVVDAIDTLDIMSKKYGEPHGGGPVGIVVAAYECLKSEGR